MLSKQEQMIILKLQEEILNRSESLAQGGAKDYAEYRENCGYLDGIRWSITAVYEVNKILTGGEQ